MELSRIDHLLQATKDLVAIESTAHNPAGLQAACEYVLSLVRTRKQNICIEQFESGGKPSFLAYRGNKRPDKFDLILNGHVDVVPGKPEQYKPVIRDGKLYGRGVYDMKAACVILADVFCEFVDSVPYTLGLQIVSDEESAGRDGTQYQIQQGVHGDLVICGESGRATTSYEIANESKGVVIADVSFSGVSAHSAYPWKGDDAIVKLANFVQTLHKHYPIPHQETDKTTISVTSAMADSGAPSKLPDRSTIKLVARYVKGDPNFASERTFTNFIHEIDTQADVHVLDFILPTYANPDNRFLTTLKSVASATENASFRYVRRHGISDGRFYNAVGGEACEFGIAGENAHGDNEYIPVVAFENYLRTMHRFLHETQSFAVNATSSHKR